MICTLGDVLLDVIVALDGPVEEDTDTYGKTRVGVGGQAANVAAWVVALGGTARLVARRAEDPRGELLTQDLERRGVEVCGPVGEGATGTVVSIATPDGRRSMLTDRGVSLGFEPDAFDPAWVDGCAWLHVSAYSLVASPLREAALLAARTARVSGVEISLDLASIGAFRHVGVEQLREAARALRPDLVFANEAEAEEFGGIGARTFVLKRGERGCTIRVDGESRDHDAVPAQLVDSTGAGDAFAAGFLLDGPELALSAAARCVATMGAMP
ncbi:MAG: carbohydrate kinase family protein [Gaiellaceae bacterium]